MRYKKVKIKENLCVYESLRNEIISMEEIQRNLWIAMYASYLTVFVLSIERSYRLLLITYIVLIPIQAQILRYKGAIIRLSNYIKVFFESERKDIHWESLQSADEMAKYFAKLNGNIASILCKVSPLLLAGISTIVFLGYTVHEYMKNNTISNIDLIWVVLALGANLLLFILIKQYNNNYGNDSYDAIMNYKKRLESELAFKKNKKKGKKNT